MNASICIFIPVAFLLVLHFPVDSAEETAAAPPGVTKVASGEDDSVAPSRSKRRSYNMMRLARGLHMLRLGKRADDGPPPETLLPGVDETEALLQELPVDVQADMETYPGLVGDEGFTDDIGPDVEGQGEEGDELQEEGEGGYSFPGEFDEQFPEEEGEEGFGDGQPGFDQEDAENELEKRRMSMLRLGKRQDEQTNNEFTDEEQKRPYGSSLRLGKRPMSMLRLGKRPMSMLRLGKRPMSMLRLGKRPMSMLRLGKRPMSMLRLGKRPMSMLRLGKRPMSMLRLGKRPMSMLRLGKRPMSMLRLGKRPMSMLRLGKRPMSMLRLGKRPMSMLRLGKRPMSMLRLGKRQMGMLRLGKRPMNTLRLSKMPGNTEESSEGTAE